MRLRLIALLGLAAPTGGTQGVRIRRVETLPQTTFTALRALYGTEFIVTCQLPDAAPAPHAATFAIPDQGFSLRLPAGWVVQSPVELGFGDLEWVWTLPDTARIGISRVRSGAVGPRSFGATPIAPALSCASAIGKSGVVWRLYDPFAAGERSGARYHGLAEPITQDGMRYALSVNARTKAERDRLARIITDAVERPR